MPERTIRIRAFPYYTEEYDAVQDKDVRVEKLAMRGDVVDLSEQDARRGDALDAFVTEDNEPTAEAQERFRDLAGKSDDELVVWLEEGKPNVQETVDAANGDANLATRILDAENAVTGRDPRDGVIDGLAKVIERAQE